MLESSAPVGDRPLARNDWRLLAAVAGALLVLAAYTLPFFPARITSATTLFSAGSEFVLDFDPLIAGQHFRQARRPPNEQLESVSIVVEAVPGLHGSAWGWLARIISRPDAWLQHLSFLICLLWPVAAAVLSLILVGRARRDPSRVPQHLIPRTIQLTLLAAPALALAWAHQVDFSSLLYRLEAQALTPGAGYWLALGGSGLLAVAALALRRETRRQVASWWALVFIVAFTVWYLTRVRPQPYYDIWRFVSDGILVTLRMVLISFVCILVVSLLGGLGRISKNPILYGVTSLYVEIVRGIPLLVQLLFIWFALPQLFSNIGEALIVLSPHTAGVGEWLTALRLSPFAAAVIGFTVCYGAYGSEIFRAGISSIHRGQMEAARSLGMNYFQAMRHIVLPQAVRVILPPVGNEFVALLKDSSLVSVLAVSDLTRRGREYMSRTFLSLDTWTLIALLYLVMTLFSSRVVEHIERRTKFER